MNIAYRKLALLEKDLIAREDTQIEIYASSPLDIDLKNRVTRILDQVRYR